MRSTKGGIDFIELPTLGQGVNHSRILISTTQAKQIDLNNRLIKVRHRGLKVKAMKYGTEGFLLDFIGNHSQELMLTGLLS